MSASRISRPYRDLHAEVRAADDVPRLYIDGLGQWLAGVVRYTLIGGQRISFDWPFAMPLLREADSSGVNSGTVDMAKRHFLNHLGTRAPGDPRSIQLVHSNGDRDARWDEDVRGTLWATIELVEGHAELLRARLGISLAPSDSTDASHTTLLGGEFRGRPTVLVFADPLPSMIRKMPVDALVRVVLAGLPATARRRWRGLVARLIRQNQIEEVRGLFLLTHRRLRDGIGNSRGVMQSGVSTDVLETLEQSLRAGEPSRKSGFQVVSLDDPDEDLGAVHGPEAPIQGEPEGVGRALERLDARSQHILRRSVSGFTQAEIAEELGISQPRVSQILTAAYWALRKHLLQDPSDKSGL
jgi:RNA polymerase sigma factor (sigma-70 family)